MGVAVAAVVFLFEIAQEILREGNVEFVSLAAVAEVDAAVVARASLPGFVAKIFGRGFFQGGEFAIQFAVREFFRRRARGPCGNSLSRHRSPECRARRVRRETQGR